MINLTKKSQKEFWNRHNGSGIVLLKTRDNEIQQFDFWLGKSGKFYVYTGNSIEIIEYLNILKRDIQED
jgi:hypothetical protein